MEVGIIAPTEFLEEFCTTKVQYCLPQLLIDNPKYRQFYIRKEQERNLIILDCVKPGWKRVPEDFEVIEKALYLFTDAIVILPSYSFNYKKTIELITKNRKRINSWGLPTAGCLEGSTKEEIKICLRKLNTTRYAIPSYLRPTLKKTTIKNSIFLDSHSCLEELDGLDGILVTSLPVRLGLEGRLISDTMPTPPSLDYSIKDTKYLDLIKKNIEETIRYYA